MGRIDDVQAIANCVIRTQQIHEGDWFEGEVLYCGQCREPRREYIDVKDGKLFVTRMCKCERDAYDNEKKRREDEEREMRLARNRENSGIEKAYEDADLKSFDVQTENRGAYNLAKNYVAQFPEMLERNQGLLFWGDVGTGKTYTASVIGNELLAKGRTVYAISLANLFQKVGGYNNEQEEELMERVRNVDLLILDDLGTERSTDFAAEKVYAVIDARYKASKPVIYTTNMTLAEMKGAADMRQKRLYDRIFQTCFPLQFTGQSRRMNEARDRYADMLALTKVS
ncbi:MAG: ATP-binding protein [Clostridia bacterium]|nr:ATP-binding protein [Clostridia bacterium]